VSCHHHLHVISLARASTAFVTKCGSRQINGRPGDLPAVVRAACTVAGSPPARWRFWSAQRSRWSISVMPAPWDPR